VHVLAAVRDRYGGPDVVSIEQQERPTPTADEVLVRVHFASVNRADLDWLLPYPGFSRLFVGVRRPRNRRLGLDAAGVVEAVGPDVARFAPGDRVFGDLYPFGHGAFAEYACAPERAFAPVPGAVDLEQAATLPHSAVLAIDGLRLRDGRTPGHGDRVLIDGASGSVGPFAVQIAKAAGARVTAVCSAPKGDLVRSLGADEVLDYARTDFTSTGDRYDWILAAESHHSILSIRRALRPRGVYVTLGGTARSLVDALAVGPVVSAATSRTMGMALWWRPFSPDAVAAILALVASGAVKPVIDRRYPLTEVADALRYVDERRATGKVIVTI
jgi:NADPH:quinone reductase-like Zn-dependent oxidoreductase